MFAFKSVCTSQSFSVQSDNYELFVSALIVLAEPEIVIAFWTVMDETPQDTMNIIKRLVNDFKRFVVDLKSLSNLVSRKYKGSSSNSVVNIELIGHICKFQTLDWILDRNFVYFSKLLLLQYFFYLVDKKLDKMHKLTGH